MKIISAQNGNVVLREGEKPTLLPRHVMVKTMYSAISPGTELSMTGSSKEEFVNIGYSASGVIVEVGNEVTNFKVGDQVAVYGAPYVGHREYLAVPQTLVAKVPASVDMKDASMAGLGAIAIHGLRQARVQFGEIVVVVGLGIYGQLIAQMAKQAGLVVLALNRSKPRVDLLEKVSGVESFTDEAAMEARLMELSNGQGADAVLLCAGGKQSPLTNKSFKWLKQRGTSVIVGDIEPNYDRELMFGKELEIRISRAGGPGRYDVSYERDAVDYPYGYVRWTEGRNVAEYVRMLEQKTINVREYYGDSTPVEAYKEAYELLAQPAAEYLSHIFTYETE